MPAFAAVKKALPDKLFSAKSIYLDNETGNGAVMDEASENFTKWGRFTILSSKEDADLVVVFTHKSGMDVWGNLGFIVMDIFVKGDGESAFQSKSAVHLIFDPQIRTRNCVADFKRALERKQ